MGLTHEWDITRAILQLDRSSIVIVARYYPFTSSELSDCPLRGVFSLENFALAFHFLRNAEKRLRLKGADSLINEQMPRLSLHGVSERGKENYSPACPVQGEDIPCQSHVGPPTPAWSTPGVGSA